MSKFNEISLNIFDPLARATVIYPPHIVKGPFVQGPHPRSRLASDGCDYVSEGIHATYKLSQITKVTRNANVERDLLFYD